MTHPNMNCPVCAVPLTMSERQNVEIDYCPQCRGVWLDRGELDKVIERSAAEAAPTPPPPSQPRGQSYAPAPQQHHGHDDRYKYKRKKSFLEELFD
ncbi:MAG: zf-TFIIB domain-containing protein [Sphingomonas sp.]|nr:zf-TFIIB domain-containing protein [Sphingomonas sp.]